MGEPGRSRQPLEPYHPDRHGQDQRPHLHPCQSVTTIDAKGRLVQAAVAGIAPVQLAYDGRGRLASLTHDDRTYTLTYDSQGYMSLLTDPLARSVGFTYDAAGRPLLLTRPDGMQDGLTYDANGNLASLTPPGRPPHTFSYTPIDLLQSYAPPDLGFTPKDTQYVYNPDRQLIQLSQPDVSASLSYDPAGRSVLICFEEGLRHGGLGAVVAAAQRGALVDGSIAEQAAQFAA
jgi:YD repeat-containing protein